MPRSFAQEATVSTMCSSDHGSGCVPSGDDTQVLLQSQKRVEIDSGSPKKLSDQELLSALLEIVEKRKRTSGEDATLSFNVQPSAHELSMSTTAVVKSGNEVLQNGHLVVTIKGKIQSVTGPTMNEDHGFGGDYGGKALYQAMIHGYGPNDPEGTDEGESLKFKYFVEELGAGSVFDLTPPTPMTFIADSHESGNARNPLELNLVVPPGAPAPAPPPCVDKTGDDFANGIGAIFGAHWIPLVPFYGLTCQSFHGWSQCSSVGGLCDQTCGQCGSTAFLQLQTKAKAFKDASAERLDFEPRVHAPNFENSMTVTICVRLVQDSECDSTGVLAVEMGNNVIQGVADKLLVPPPLGPFGGQHHHLLMVHGYGPNDKDNAGNPRGSDDGKPLKFLYFIEGEGKLYDLEIQGGSAMTFVTNDNKGNALDPVFLTIAQ